MGLEHALQFRRLTCVWAFFWGPLVNVKTGYLPR